MSSYFYFLTTVRAKKDIGDATIAQKWYLGNFPMLFAVSDLLPQRIKGL